MRYKGIIMKYVGISIYKAIMESHYENIYLESWDKNHLWSTLWIM